MATGPLQMTIYVCSDYACELKVNLMMGSNLRGQIFMIFVNYIKFHKNFL